MGKEITLRNLYKMLTQNDYPIPSFAVLSKRNRGNLTQSLFLSEAFLPAFQEGSVGRMLWHVGDKRSRYYSNMCNRSLPRAVYAQYALEIRDSLTPDTVSEQIRHLMMILEKRNYRHPEMIQRLDKVLEMAAMETAGFSDKASIFFEQIRCRAGELWAQKDIRGLAVDAWVLFVLMLYAVTDESFPLLIGMQALNADFFSTLPWNDGLETGKQGVRWIGLQENAVLGMALSSNHYFGHEQDRFDLVEAIRGGEKVVVSGIGGMGKTELIRQVLRQCAEENLVDAICVVPWLGSMRFSFQRNFPEVGNGEEDEFRDEVLSFLSEKLGEKGVLVIDNLDRFEEEDRSWLDLLSCMRFPVVLTSRAAGFDGFCLYPIDAPTKKDCLLIYRDHLGRVMARDEQDVFLRLMDTELFRHPQTVRLLSRTVGYRGLSLEEVSTGLREEESLLLSDRTGALYRMYNRLYTLNNLSTEEKQIASFFALLPAYEYSLNWLSRSVPAAEENAEALLEHLYQAGFLQKGKAGFSMHPLIAECLRRKNYDAESLEQLLGRASDAMTNDWERLMLKTDLTEEERCSVTVFCGLAEEILDQIEAGRLIRAVAQSLYLSGWFSCAQIRKKDKLLPALLKTEADPIRAEEIFRMICGVSLLESPDSIRALYERCAAEKTPGRDEVHRTFLLTCAIHLKQPENIETGIQMLRDALNGCVNPLERLIGLSTLIDLYTALGDYNTALTLSDECMSLLNTEKLESGNALFGCLRMLTRLNQITRRDEVYQELITRMRQILTEEKQIRVWESWMKCEIAATEAVWYLQHGQPEKALDALREHMNRLRKANPDHPLIITDLGTVALTYMRLGQLEDSEKAYEEAVRSIPGKLSPGSANILLNNYAVLCLEKKDPEKALELLEKALAQVPDQPSAHAEPYRNMGRAYDMMNDRDKALACWEKALPLLEANYGAEHPRCVEAKNRVTALKTEC